MPHPHDHAGCSHNHSHGHSHAPRDFTSAFFLGVLLNIGFIIAEVIYGLQANSLALLADAGHNVSDVLGLCMAWGAAVLAKRLPSERFTYGMRSSSILASLANAILLLVVVGGIGWESMMRMIHPEPAASLTMIYVAALGVFINGATAWFFMAGRHDDLNIRGAYLHMAGDAVISLGVVVSGMVMLYTQWLWIDPLMSFIISGLIIFGTWRLLRESLTLVLHAVPVGIDAVKVKEYLAGLAGVCEVHDLHIWAMSTNEVASSVHLVMPNGHPGDKFILDITQHLEHDFNISHTTIQIELGDGETACPLAPDYVV
jgi:cobalt-zinc-cadmium efflux system protein